MRGLFRTYWAWTQFARTGSWARQAAAAARQLIDPGVHFAIVTSGPPHMTHECGSLVSESTGVPFVMDMRDPWSLSQRIHEAIASPLWLRLAARYERRAVNHAALVVANTEPARQALAKTYPTARERIIAVMNGSDDEPIPPARRAERFTIGYAGTIYLERDPRNLFRAAARVIRDLDLRPDRFGIDFIGAMGPGERSLDEMAQQEGIAEFVTIGPARTHPEALAFLAEATMLVTFPGWNTITIPAKLFECVRFDAWVLALSERGSATDLLLQGTEADVVSPEDVAGIAAVIRKRYEEHAQGVRPARLSIDERFSRRTQARILLDAIARLVPQDAAERPRSALITRS
jgi:glycosyltransferase involved in cell wall biosynthesis